MIHKDLNKVIAVDLGGTKLHAAVITGNADILEEIKVNTKKDKGREGLMESLFSIINKLYQKHEVCKIAIASAGRINVDTGTVYYATDNLPNWTDTKLKQILEERFHLPVIVDNDVNAAGLGEYWIGSSNGKKNNVCITLGTGIAGAIMIDGKLVRGEHWSGGEIGHMVIHPNGKQCNCGLKGCFEQYCSGTSLVSRYNELSSTKINSGYDFFNHIEQGEETSLEVLEEFIDDLTLAIVMLSNVLDPETFVIGGGLIDTRKYWWDKLIVSITASPITEVFTPNIVPASLGNYAGLYGIANLAFEEFRKPFI